MQIQDLFFTSTSSLSRNKSRSSLTILGIVIGIASVILMLSIGKSAEGLILNQVADLGSDLVFIEPSSGDPNSGPPNLFIEQTVNLKDVEALRKSPYFNAVDATIFTTVTVSHENQSSFVQIAGVTDQYIEVYPADMLYGRFLVESDIDSGARVAVLGKEIAQELFGDQNPVGQRISVKQTSVRVVGVFDEQGTRFFQNLDKQIAVPVSMMQKDILGVDYVNFITARASVDVEIAKEEARFILRDQHNIDNPEGLITLDDFFVSSQSDAQEIIGVIGTVLSLLLVSIAGISLVVGGIGIMNIMLVSVSERTKEIGLRKAMGATYKEILQQFLLEAVMLTLTGGIVGVAIGISLSLGGGFIAAQYVDGWKSGVPVIAVVLGLVVSSGVGIVFGIYPAQRAAKLEPVEALRYE